MCGAPAAAKACDKLPMSTTPSKQHAGMCGAPAAAKACDKLPMSTTPSKQHAGMCGAPAAAKACDKLSIEYYAIQANIPGPLYTLDTYGKIGLKENK